MRGAENINGRVVNEREEGSRRELFAEEVGLQ
jgi:hypothetical protein